MSNRQREALRKSGLTAEHRPGYGAGAHQEQVFGAARETHREPAGFEDTPIRDVDGTSAGPRRTGGVRGYESRPVPPNDTYRRKFDKLPVPGSAAPSRRASFADDRPSAPGSQAASRQPSRQPSRQSSVERVRDAFVGGASAHSSNQVRDADRGRPEGKIALPKVLKHEVRSHQHI